MNLLTDKWLPVQRKSGKEESIALWQITEDIDTDPVEKIQAPRPDFHTTLVQFLIGLLQTAFPPTDDYAWLEIFNKPPAPQGLRESFLKYEHAFEADGEGPRFMQDFDLPQGEKKEIGTLLIEEPGANTLRENKDHFIKRGNAKKLGISSAISALMTLQCNAPSGGAGHRTSIRGGGPLTTLIEPDPLDDESKNTLWHLLWLNVLPGKEFERLCGNPEKTDDASIFPWLGPTRTSDKSGRDTTPEDVHPLQMYWSMPRRIRLEFKDTVAGLCPMTGRREQLIEHFVTKNYGINYSGPWRHPLSPYRLNNEGQPLPLHPQPDGLGYRHWLGYALGENDGVMSASVVHYHCFKSSKARRGVNARLWVFGYDMDNMKARGWHEAHMPLFHLDEPYKKLFSDAVQDILDATGMVAKNLRGALKQAWFSPKAKVRGDLSFIEASFWQNTEPIFYELLDKLHATIIADSDETSLYHFWFGILNQASLDLFDSWAASGSIEDEDPKRIVLARRDLENFNNKKAIRSALRLDIKAAA